MELLVINHHYIREETYKKGIYPISPADFDRNIRNLLRKGWHPISLEELIHGRINHNRKYFLITFDDGLKCSYKYGLPILRKYSIKGIYFIPTKILEGKPLDVHLIHFIRSKLEDDYLLNKLIKMFPYLQSKISIIEATRQYRYDDEAAAVLKYLINFILNVESREKFIKSVITEIFPYGINAFFKSTYMSADDIKELIDESMIGSHGHNHLPLAKLSDEELTFELCTPVNLFTKFFGNLVNSISYPYGGPTAVSQRVYEYAANCGYKIGFTMKRGVNITTNHLSLNFMRIDVKDLDNFI